MDMKDEVEKLKNKFRTYSDEEFNCNFGSIRSRQDNNLQRASEKAARLGIFLSLAQLAPNGLTKLMELIMNSLMNRNFRSE